METTLFEVFFDGDCPLCMREIALLRRLDRRGRLRFTDIAAPGFDPASTGKTYAQLMDVIYGRMPDGRLVEGVEVFRQLYAAVGLGPLVSLTRLPGVSHLLDVAYRLFAKNRLRLTGRCVKDADGACAVSPSASPSVVSSVPRGVTG
jgi:predicted DCC family thiol-disulfide oxidoreductase YuxK